MDKEAPVFDECGYIIKEADVLAEFMAAFKDGTHNDLLDATLRCFH